jgi:hypothetical protein
MKRRYLITIRDIKGILMELLCPIILILFGLGIAKLDMDYKSGPAGVDISEIGKQKIIFSSINNIDVSNYFINDINNVKSEEIRDFIGYTPTLKAKAVKDFVDKIYDIEKDTEDCSKHEVDMTSEDYTGYYS